MEHVPQHGRRLATTLLLAILSVGLGAANQCGVAPDPSAATALDAVSVDLGDVPVGKTVTIVFEATIDTPLLPPGTVMQLSTQGSVQGSNFATVPTDDPDTPAMNDPTVTPIVYVEGDLNQDGVHNFDTDSAVFFAQFGDVVGAFVEPDYDGDGIVALADYSIFRSFF